jgi:predicted HicB family RNase H-like nuclease
MAKNKVRPAAEHFTYRLLWSSKDDEYIATVAEFPSLSWISSTRKSALEGLTSMVEDVIADMTKSGEAIPEPWDERKFSGKFNLRLGSELHRAIALKAAEKGESLNTYVVKQLSTSEN